MKGRFIALLGVAACISCGPSATKSSKPAEASPSLASKPTPELLWAEHTYSPQAFDQPPRADLLPVYASCGKPDEALARVAARLSQLLSSGTDLKDAALKLALRVEGAPYLWPRVWSLVGSEMQAPELASRVQAWAQGSKGSGEARCGVAQQPLTPGQSITTVVAVDVAADIDPVPVRAHVGKWITLRASLHEGVAPEVFLQGPRGRPRHALVKLRAGRLESSFVLSEPGAWTVQLITTGKTGPIPVAEALVFADVEPPRELEWPAASGESLDDPNASDVLRVFTMLNGARREENLKPLAENSDLSKLAQAHADAMRDSGQIGHDIGSGGPKERVQRTGLVFKQLGENVAFALSAPRAHRALWSSPSHRFTMLHPDFDAVGIGATKSADGSLWVCELFAKLK